MNNAQFKIDIFWDAWSTQMQNRILRDMMTLSRLAASQATLLVVACDEVLHPYLKLCNISAMVDFTGADLIRVYVQEGDYVPDEVYQRLPQDQPFDIVPLTHRVPTPDYSVPNALPYANMPLKEGFKRIAPTLSIDKPAPKGIGEPLFSPFL